MRKRRRIVLTVQGLKIRRSSSFQLSVPFLAFTPGSAVCIVGANGSGKTTLVEAVVGLITPREGGVKVSGLPAHLDHMSVRRAVGYIPDDDTWIIPELTAQEFLGLLVSIYGKQTNKKLLRSRVKDLADQLYFDNYQTLIGRLSHGNKKKLQIIAALMHEPDFIVVDELRNGLDPIAIKQAEQLLRQKQLSGAAIIAATHDLWWAERFAAEIVMIRRGQVVLNEYTKDIVARSGTLEARFMEVYAHAS